LFIVVDSGTAIRNILRTDVLHVLKQRKDLRIVIFSPLEDADFQRETAADNILLEKLPPPTKIGKSREAFIQSLKADIWAKQTGIFTINSNRNLKLRGRIMDFILRRLLCVDKPGRSEALIQRLEKWRISKLPLLGTEWFDRYQPNLVFFTTLYARQHPLEFGAQQHGIKTAAFVTSWDNPTSKGPFHVRPDRIIVWNELLREEVIQYHGYRPEQIYISGVPQFDIYTQRDRFLSREAFFKKLGLDPARKLITYTTGTQGTAPLDHEVVEQLYHSMRQGKLRHPCQLLVRLHPKDVAERYQHLHDKPDLVFQSPGRHGTTSDSWNPTREDMFGLAELMHYSDVVVNVASTITIDAACFDTPVVNIAYDGYTSKPYPISTLRYYDFEHYRRIVEAGGVRIARSNEETIRHIQSYLDDPTLETEGRRKIREQQCWKLDGQSGRRIAEYLLAFLDSKS
jgi:hypothetical protein